MGAAHEYETHRFEVVYLVASKGKPKTRKRKGFGQLQDALSFAALRPRGTASVWIRYGTLWKPLRIPVLKKPPPAKPKKKSH